MFPTVDLDNTQKLPVVMCFSGADATGGAGIQADIETIISMGAHPCPVITAITVQDTQNLQHFQSVDHTLVIEQARAVLEDMPVQVFKLGMLGGIENIEAIHSLLVDYPEIPVVLDPVLAAGGGTSISSDAMIDAMINLLLPLTTVITPNSLEARRLAQAADTLEACAMELQDMGCEYVLVTGGHEATRHVENHLYANHRLIETFNWERLPHNYHGSGCTLAAAIAAMLAQGLDPFMAIHEAQQFTWDSLQHGYRLGMGQWHPNRLFWARDDDNE
ncbi:MAG: hydroxymethylpyrimidine/phosphomethylpyrimidine kinase [Thioalkalispiraceae bacterium]|jgi:hydroxymethylpyrimidine/phosphomethylpyrimidine kinase